MSDRPLDLGVLADVEAPDVVQGALRRFRRRLAARAFWVVLLVLVVATYFGQTRRAGGLPGRIARSPGTPVGTSVDDPVFEVTLVSAHGLDATTIGLEILIDMPGGQMRGPVRSAEALVQFNRRLSLRERLFGLRSGEPILTEEFGQTTRATVVWIAMPRGRQRFSLAFFVPAASPGTALPRLMGNLDASPGCRSLLAGRDVSRFLITQRLQPVCFDMAKLGVPDRIWRVR